MVGRGAGIMTGWGRTPKHAYAAPFEQTRQVSRHEFCKDGRLAQGRRREAGRGG